MNLKIKKTGKNDTSTITMSILLIRDHPFHHGFTLLNWDVGAVNVLGVGKILNNLE